MNTYTLHLIRHGITQGNLDGIYVGGGMDISLCEEGRAELRVMAAQYLYPRVPLLFASPMRRALESADILFPTVPGRLVLEELRESRFGEFEGRKAGDLMGDERYLAWLDPKSGFVPEGGESGESFATRTRAALLLMLRHMASQGITEAACVTHGGVIMSIMSQCAYPRMAPQKWMCGNGCGFTVRADAAMIGRDEVVEAIGLLPAGYSGGHSDEAAEAFG